MDDDFNTALTMSVLFGLAKEMNIYQSAVAGGKAEYDPAAVAAAKQVYLLIGEVLGIFCDNSVPNAGDNELVSQLVDLIIELRQQARQNKQWAVADQLRDRLGEIGILLEDTPQGVRWKRR